MLLPGAARWGVVAVALALGGGAVGVIGAEEGAGAEGQAAPQQASGGGEPQVTTIVELAGGWQNLLGGVAVALFVGWALQGLLAWREAQIDAAYAAKEKARLAKVDEYRQQEIAKMREARLKREAEQAVLRAKRDEEKAAAMAEGRANRDAKKKEAHAALQRRKEQLGKHVLESMNVASSDAMVDGRVTSSAAAASPEQVSSAASATIAKISTLKSGQLKEVLRSLELDAKGSTAILKKRLLEAAASSGKTATAISRHALVNTALPEKKMSLVTPSKKPSSAAAKSLIAARGEFPARSVVVHWTGRERRENIDVSENETVGGLKAKISGNVIFANPPSAAQKLVCVASHLANARSTVQHDTCWFLRTPVPQVLDLMHSWRLFDLNYCAAGMPAGY